MFGSFAAEGLPDSIAELKALGIDMSDYDPMKLPEAKDLLKSFK